MCFRVRFIVKQQSCPILPHCYGPLRTVNGPYVLHKPSLLLTVRMLSTYGACISLLHEGTMPYGSFDPYDPHGTSAKTKKGALQM